MPDVEDDRQRDEALYKVLGWEMPSHTGDTSAARPIAWAAAVQLTMALVALVVGWLLLGVFPEHNRGAWGAALVGPVAGLLLAAVMTARGPRARRRATLGAVGAIGAGLALAVAALLVGARPTPVEVRAALDQLRIPGRPELATRQIAGDRLCRSACPTATETWVLPGRGDHVATVAGAMMRQGWSSPDGLPASQATLLRHGQLQANIGSGARDDEVRVDLSATG